MITRGDREGPSRGGGATFLLSGSCYRLGEATIGLFGLTGAAAAPSRAGSPTGTGPGSPVSWGLLAAGAVSLVALIAGVVLLDLAQQTLQISHQSAIYEQARSRVTTAYIVAVFVGGAAASAATSAVYPAAGWLGVTVLGGAIAVEHHLRRADGKPRPDSQVSLSNLPDSGGSLET